MTRICKVKGFRGFIGGKDNDGVFKEGVIYEVKEILGQITLTPIGVQPKYDSGGNEIDKLNLEELIISGDYLLFDKN